uniref:DNA polymerase delta n=1 Tax=Clandestinovirus TaxID=2831644 RepID=A0A8F8KPK2_9VIRU|nr:DNA polymerase delta [Clandestinovirus]
MNNLLKGLSFEATKAAPAKKKSAAKKAASSATPYVTSGVISLDTSTLMKKAARDPNSGPPKAPTPVVPVQQSNFVVVPKSSKVARFLPLTREEPVKKAKIDIVEEDETNNKCRAVQPVHLPTFTGSPWMIYSTRLNALDPTIHRPMEMETLQSLSQEDAEYSVTGFSVVLVNMTFDAEATHTSVVTMYEKKKQVPDNKTKLYLPPLIANKPPQPSSNIQIYLQRNGQTIRVSNAEKFRGKLIHGSIIGVVITTIPDTTDCILESIVYPTFHIRDYLVPRTKRTIIARTKLQANTLNDEQWNEWSNNLIIETKNTCYSGLKPIVFLQDLFSTTRPSPKALSRLCGLVECCSAFASVILIPGWDDPTLKTFPQSPFNPVILRTTGINKVPVIYAPNPCANFKDEDENRYAWIEYDVLQLLHRLVFELPYGEVTKELAAEGWKMQLLSIEMMEKCITLLLHCKHLCPLTPMFTVGSGASDQQPDPLVIHEIPHHILVFGCPLDLMANQSTLTYQLDDSTAMNIDIMYVSQMK